MSTPIEVLFRAERSGRHKGEVTAVLTCPGEPTFDMRGEAQCYAHVGQHSTCHVGWYFRTRAAKPAEYEALKRELVSIGYVLSIRHKRRM